MATLCYCILLRRAARRVTAIYDEALAPIGVNLAQFSLLRNIERAGPVSLTELGRLTELDRSTIGRNVRVLARMALVRSVDGKDQREATIALTEKGKSILEAGAAPWDTVQRQIDAALGADRSDQLRDTLHGLAQIQPQA